MSMGLEEERAVAWRLGNHGGSWSYRNGQQHVEEGEL